MKLGQIFLIFFVCALTFLGECPMGSVASQLCPVRAIPVYPSELNGDVRCVCTRQFFGKNCRFKDQNGTVVLNATRVSQSSVILTWKEKEEQSGKRRYLVSVRKIAYTLLGTTHNKWRTVRMELLSSNMTAAESDIIEGTKATGHSAMLTLPITSSYEVKVTSINLAGENVGSTSVFFDALNVSLSGQTLGISDALNNFKNDLIKDFQDACVLKGIVTGIVVGTLGTLMMMAIVCVLMRYCCKCKKQQGIDENSVAQEQTIKEVTIEESSDKKSNPEVLSRSSSYVIIDINDIEPVVTETTATKGVSQQDESNNTMLEVNKATFNPEEPIVSKDDTQKAEKVRSVILDIPETVIDGERFTEVVNEAEIDKEDVKPRTIWEAIDLE